MNEVRVQNAFGVSGLELSAVGEIGTLLSLPAQPNKEVDLKVEASIGGGSVALFDQALKVSAEAGASLALKVHEVGGTVMDPFGRSEAPPAQQRWSELAIAGALAASGSGNASSGPFRFSAKGTASAELDYRRVFPVPGSLAVDNIAKLALQGARFPGRFFDRQLLPGEWQRLEGRLRFGFDFTAGAGFESEYREAVELFNGFSPEIKATAQASIGATLGLSLFESTEILVHRPLDAPEGRLRLRIARVRDRGLTFGAKVALGLEANLGSVLNKTLDHIFALEPIADVFEVWEEIAAFGSAETWDQLEAKLSKKAVDTVLGLFRRYVDLESSATVDKVIGEVGQLLKKYDALDGRIKDLWADLLEHGGLGADSDLRRLLGNVAKLEDLEDRKQALTMIAKLKEGSGSREFLEVIELLSGETLEELISSPEAKGLEEALHRVAARAREALDLIEGNPFPKALEALHQFAQESGIAAVVEKLRANASSAAGLQEAVERPLRKVVSRLFHKAWESLENSELQLLRQWAEKVAGELKDFQKWEEKLRADLKRLDEKLGITLSFELSRQFHQEAFLDADLNDRIWEKTSFREDLQNGDLPALIRRLAKAAVEEDTDEAIEIRECAFLTRRIRSSTWSLLIEGLGFKFLRQVGSLRTIQTRERIAEDGTTFEIRGASERFSKADLGKEDAASNKEVWRSKAELVAAEALTGSRFEPKSVTLVLGISLEDDKMIGSELKALDRLLEHLGLESIDGKEAAALAGEPNARFSLVMQLSAAPATLLGALAKTPARKDLLAEVERLYRDELVGATEAAFEPGLRAGDVMAQVIDASGFGQAMKDQLSMIDFLRTHKATVNGKVLDLFENLPGRPATPIRSLVSLPVAVNSHWPRKAKATGKALARASEIGAVGAWRELAQAVVAQHNALVLDGYSINPMLGFYVFFANLASAGLAVHAAASLQVQTKTAGAAEWSVPILWQR